MKHTEMGSIPENWELLKFGDLLSEPTRNGIYKPKDFHGHGVKIINMGELFGYARIAQQPMKRIDLTSKEVEKFEVRKGDLLFARRSLVAEGAGKCSIVELNGEKRVFESSIIRARLDFKKYNPEFYFYFFRSEIGLHQLDTIRRQVAVAGITGSDLISLTVPVPPLPEQTSIVKILSNLDKKIELNQKMNKTLEAIAQAIFKHWFIDFEFPNEEGKPYKSSGGEMVDSELGEIPKGWKIGYLGDLLNIRREHCDPSQETRTLPYVPIDCISKRSLMLTDHKPGEEARSSLIKFHKFDIIFGAMRPYFHKVCIAPFEGTTRTTAFVFYPKDLNDYAFLVLTVFSERTIKYANLNSTGSTIPYAAWENSLETMPIVIPFTAVRHNFNKIIVNMLISIGEYLPNQIVTLKNIRDSLLPKLMSGKIRVPLED